MSVCSCELQYIDSHSDHGLLSDDAHRADVAPGQLRSVLGMPYRIFLLSLAFPLRLNSADRGRLGNGVQIGAGLIEEVDALDDVPVRDGVEASHWFLVLVFFAHAVRGIGARRCWVRAEKLWTVRSVFTWEA